MQVVPGGTYTPPAPHAPPIVNQLPPQFKPSAPALPVSPAAPPPVKSGYNPYASDPGYQAALQNETAGMGSLQSLLNSQIQQRILGLGDPGLAAKYGIDPAVLAAMNSSGNSVESRLGQTHTQNLRAVVNQLAGRGLLFSGDTGYQTGQENQNYGHSLYDAQQQALSDILGYQSSALQQQQSLHQGVIDALQTAYQNYLNHPELGGYGAGAPPAGTTGIVGDPNAFGTAAQVIAALQQLSHTPDARNG